jgi:hypothetical protein
MPDIIKAFTSYLRENLPKMYGEDFDQEKLNAILDEVRDHLSEDPPNMAAITDMLQ